MKHTNISHFASVLLITLIFASVLFVAGIPMIPLGVINGKMWITILGIVFTAGGFFGLPFAWTFFGTVKSWQRVHYAITKEGITEISALAKHLNRSERNIKATVNNLINRLYLTGYVFNPGDTGLVLSQKTPRVKNKCENCGAPIVPDATKCSYCGIYYKKQRKEI